MLRKVQQQTYIQASFWVASAAVGSMAVLYARLVNGVLNTYFTFFNQHPYVMTTATPFLFILAAYIVVNFGPDAKGSGIPQVLEAISHTKNKQFEDKNNPLVSIRTAIFKILSSLVGFIAGASIGREGPTVQISSSIFSWVSHKMKKKQIPH